VSVFKWLRWRRETKPNVAEEVGRKQAERLDQLAELLRIVGDDSAAPSKPKKARPTSRRHLGRRQSAGVIGKECPSIIVHGVAIDEPRHRPHRAPDQSVDPNWSRCQDVLPRPPLPSDRERP
jgi:hypothetical protein